MFKEPGQSCCGKSHQAKRLTEVSLLMIIEQGISHGYAMLEKLKQLLVLNWRQTVSARSRVKLAIEDLLDQGLPRAYTPDLYKQKCSAVFEHVYEVYGERGASLYGQSHGV